MRKAIQAAIDAYNDVFADFAASVQEGGTFDSTNLQERAVDAAVEAAQEVFREIYNANMRNHEPYFRFVATIFER